MTMTFLVLLGVLQNKWSDPQTCNLIKVQLMVESINQSHKESQVVSSVFQGLSFQLLLNHLASSTPNYHSYLCTVLSFSPVQYLYLETDATGRDFFNAMSWRQVRNGEWLLQHITVIQK